MNKRLTYIDMAKGIGIILVLFGHLEYTYSKVLIWISSFHMPLFFVLSGITLALSDREEYTLREKLIRKCRTILIPYMWFSLIYFVVDIGNLILHKIDTDTFIYNAISSLTFYGKSVMWFLTALFLSELTLLSLNSLFSGKRRAFLYVMAAVVMIAALSYGASLWLCRLYEANRGNLPVASFINILKTVVRAGIVLPYVGVGYYMTKGDLHGSITGHKGRLIRLVTGLALLAINISIALYNGIVDTNNMILNNPLLYYIGGLTGSLATICICEVLPDIVPLITAGRYSLVIMALHLDLYVLWAGLQAGKQVYRYAPYPWVLATVTVLCTLVIGCIAGYVIDRYFPFILGRRRIKDAGAGHGGRYEGSR